LGEGISLGKDQSHFVPYTISKAWLTGTDLTIELGEGDTSTLYNVSEYLGFDDAKNHLLFQKDSQIGKEQLLVTPKVIKMIKGKILDQQ
jgi:hypothetical protein